MKRILLLILCILMATGSVSCHKAEFSQGGRPELTDMESLESVKAIDVYAVLREEPDEEYLTTAAEEIKKLFDIDLTFTAQLSLDVSGTKSAAQLKSTGGNGIYLFPYASISRIWELDASGDILPLDKYLAENPIWNELPAAMRKMYENADGDVMALPRGFSPVLWGRVFRADYLKALGLEMPVNLDELYEVTKALSAGDPDGNGINDTFGMIYSDARSFRDIFYANGVPVNVSNDGYQRTSISYNMKYESFEDSMLMPSMPETLEYITKLEKDGFLRKLGWRSSSSIYNPRENPSVANVFTKIPGYAFTDETFAVSPGIAGSQTQYLTPLTYDFNDGFYVLGANTENPGATISTFLNTFYGDLEGYLFASRGVQGETYNYSMGKVEVLDRKFFSYTQLALVKSNPLYSYETMAIELNAEFADGSFLNDLVNNIRQREVFIEKGRQSGAIYDVTMDLAYPEVFTMDPGQIINSQAGPMFDSQFNRLMSGRTAVEDAIEFYRTNMQKLGMQEVIDELNERIGATTNFKY